MTRYLTAILLIVMTMAGCSMIDLSTNPNFQAQLDDGGKPATIVHVQEDVLEAEKTLEADWAANTAESNVDYTSSPPDAGDVVISKHEKIESFETGGDAFFLGNWDPGNVQGFQISSTTYINKIGVYLKLTSAGDTSVTLKIATNMTGGISGGPSGIIATSNAEIVNSTSGAWYQFDFSEIELTGSTQYYLYIDAATIKVSCYIDANNGYSNGTFWYIDVVEEEVVWVELTTHDTYFRIYEAYKTTGNITTDNIDLGSTPTGPGEWQMQDTKPDDTTLTYEAWYSDSGVFDIWHDITQDATKPAPRRGAKAIVNGTKIYLFGGYDGSTYYNDVWEYETTTRTWTEISTTGGPPTARYDHSLVLYNGKMYVFGGYDGSTYRTDVWELDLTSFAWISKASGSTGRSRHTAIVYNNKMYIYGGWNGSSSPKDVWEYDFSVTWTLKPTTGGPSLGYFGHTSIESSGKMYSLCGFSGGSFNSHVWELNLSTFAWIQKTSGPSGSEAGYITAVLYNGIIYYYGGYNGPSSGYQLDTNSYDIAGDTWGTEKSNSVTRSAYAAVIYNGTLYIIGGVDDTPTHSDSMYSYGTLGGDAVSIGTIADGDPITDLKQYFQVEAYFTSNTTRDKTPTLHSIKADFSTYKTFTDCLRIAQENDYEMGLMPISGISSEISDFKESTIGQITPVIDFNESISKYLYSKYPKNKIVKVLIGFDDPAFPVSDFLEFFRGQIVDYNLMPDDKVALITQAFQVEWNKKVPETWEDGDDDVTWTNMHPIDVMLDIIRNYMDVRDSKIVASSFAEVKDLIPSYTVTRTITKNPVEAKKLMEELRLLTSSYFLPRSDGKIKIKRFDPSEAVVATLTDANTKDMGGYKGNLKTIINKTLVYFAHDGDGDDAADYLALAIDVTTGADSHDNWGEWKTKEVKDKWTLEDDLAQVVSMSDVQLARYKNPPAIITRVGDKKLLYIEAGDMVAVTTKRAPSADGVSGIVDKKFQVIKPSLDFKGDKVTLTLLEV